MKHILKLILLISLITSFIKLKAIQDINSIEISVITCEPGNDIYSLFGHTAIRVHDLNGHTDVAYNYGTFSFNNPDFYLNFVLGKLNYTLSVESFKRFMFVYKHEGRKVEEQVLNLNAEEKVRLLELLKTNYLPQNREYRYDFLFDNCATRVRDIVNKAITDSITMPGDTILHNKSFRTLLDFYTDKIPIIQLGINLALGTPTDKKLTAYSSMFMPDCLLDVYSHSQIITNNKSRPLVIKTNILNKHDESKHVKGNKFIFYLILILIISPALFIKKMEKFSLIYIKIIISVLSFISIVLLFLWFGTEHNVMRYNFHSLWGILTLIPIITSKKTLIKSSIIAFFIYFIYLIVFTTISGYIFILSIPYFIYLFNYFFKNKHNS